MLGERAEQDVSHDVQATRRAKQAALVFGAMFAMVAAYIIGWESNPLEPWPQPRWTGKEVNRGFFYSGTTAFVLVAAYFGLRGRSFMQSGRARSLVLGVAVAAIAGTSMYYFSAVHGLRNPGYSHRWDTYHYLLGPKYYDEINYFDLYRCTAQAAPRIPGKGKTKFLESYEKATVNDLREQAECKTQFSPERWEAFKNDLEIYGKRSNYRAVGNMMHDLGYNGTPTHSAVAGFVANQFELTPSSLVRSSLFDIFFIFSALTAAVWAFGWRLGLCFALFFFVDAVDRFSVDGASFFRHLWSASLVVGIACLKRGRHGWAGFCLTASTALNVFPVVFVVGVGAKMLWDWWRERAMPGRLRRYILGSLVACVLFGGAGMTSDRGAGAYGDFFENMETHNVRGRFPGFGVGLKFNFVDYGKDRAKSGTTAKSKAKGFEKRKSPYLGLTILLIGLALAVSTRLDDARASVLTGFTLMFCQLETTGYYFAVVALLIFLWAGEARRARGAVMILALFGANVWWLRSLHEDSLYYVFNVTISGGLLLYLGACLFTLGQSTGLFDPLTRWLTAPGIDEEE